MGLNQLSLSHYINIPCDTESNHFRWKTVGLNQLSLSCHINIPCDTESNHSECKTVLEIKSTISVMPHQHTRQSRIAPGGRLSVGCNTCCFGTPARKKMHIYRLSVFAIHDICTSSIIPIHVLLSTTKNCCHYLKVTTNARYRLCCCSNCCEMIFL